MTSDADQVEASTCQRASVCICLLRQREPGKRTISISMTPVAQFANCKNLMNLFYLHQIKIPKKSIQRSPNLKKFVQLPEGGGYPPNVASSKLRTPSNPLTVTFRTKVGDDGPSAVALPPPSRAHEVLLGST